MFAKPFFENDFITMWIHQGIIYSELSMNAHVSYESIKEAIDARKIFTKGKAYPMLMDLRNIKSIENKARKYSANKEATEGISAGAMVVSTKVEQVIAKMFVFVDRPPMPIKIFHDRQKAVEWLEDHKVKESEKPYRPQ